MVEPFEVAGTDKLRQVAVAGVVFRQQDQVIVRPALSRELPLVSMIAGSHVHLATDDRAQASPDRGAMKLKRPEQVAMIGDGDGRHPGLGHLLDQLLGPNRRVEQRVVSVKVEVNERRDILGPRHELMIALSVIARRVSVSGLDPKLYTRRMKDIAAKLMPYLVGIAIAVVLISGPDLLTGLGALRYLAVGLAAVVALMLFLAVVVHSNLPSRLILEPVTEWSGSGEAERRVRELEALGFDRTGPIYRVPTTPAGLLQPLVHRTEPIYATVFRTGTLPAKVGHELVSLFSDRVGGLTSVVDPAAVVLPAPTSVLRQVLVGAAPERLLEAHREAMAYLAGAGLSWKPVSAASFEHDFTQAMVAQRRFFIHSPVRHVAVALWRSVTRRSPHLGPIAQQQGAQRFFQSCTPSD